MTKELEKGEATIEMDSVTEESFTEETGKDISKLAESMENKAYYTAEELALIDSVFKIARGYVTTNMEQDETALMQLINLKMKIKTQH